MKKILVPFGCRSDMGLSEPIVKRLREIKEFDVRLINLFPQDFMASYQKMDYYCKAEKHIGNHNAEKPDLVFITGDRVEMCAAACAAFHNRVKIAHYYAGVVNNPITTFDDIDRHCITLWSDIHFCESVETAINTEELLVSAGQPKCNKSGPRVHVVGISHLDDLKIDESEVIYDFTCSSTTHETLKQKVSPYDLVLINSINDLKLPKFKFTDIVIGIGSNPDGEVNLEKWVGHVLYAYYDNLPRAQFLGLLKNCQRFITNSSSAIYEAPHFLKPEQIIMIGDRNKNRPKGPFETGASDKIVKILQEYLK